MRANRPAALLTTLLLPAVLLAASPSQSATPASGTDSPRKAMGWTKVSTGTVDSLSEITTLRTGDGVLHAVYAQDTGTTGNYEHTTLSTTGAVTGHSDVLGSWGALVSKPKLLPTLSGGMRLVFSGLQDTDTSNFYSHGYAYDTISDASGAAWSLQPRALTKFGSAYAGYGLGATLLSNGTPVTASPLNSGLFYRVGDIPTTDQLAVSTYPDDGSYTSPSCCLYETQLVNSGDNVWMAWYANGSSEETNGTFVQQIHPTPGPVIKAPGSSIGADSLSPSQSVAMVARPGGGVVLAYALGYPNTTAIGLWQVGSSSVVKVPNSKDASQVALGAGATGRMWLAWRTGSSVSALRTSATGFGLGAVQDLGSPTGGSDLRSIAVDASLNQGTVLINDAASTTVYSILVNPGLSLKAKPTSIKAGQKKKVTFKVTDAGEAVAGVKVKGGGESCTTNASGVCKSTYKVTKVGKLKLAATKGGYGSAKAEIKVKK